jgi:hypothetical protein
MSTYLFVLVLLTLLLLDGSWSVPVCLREQAPFISYELRAPNKVFFRLVFPTGGFRQGWGALGFRRTECVAGSGASCMANADYIVFIASAPNAVAFYSTSPTAANGAPTAAALTYTLDYVNQCCVNGITKEIEFVRSTDAFGGGVPLNTAGRQTLLWAYSTSAADPAVFSQHAATTRGAISFDWRGTGLCSTAPPTVPPPTTRPTSTTTTTTTTTILTTTTTAPAATTVCTACDVNFGIPGTSTWCGCCFNNCGGNRAACVNNGFCSSRCREARYGCAATTVPSVGTPVPAAALRACDFKRDECWKKCGSSKYFAFECEHEVNSFDTVVKQCTVPSGCNCAPCQQLNCNECSWQDPSFSNTLGWCNCCASNCNGFLAACEAGNVFCKTACTARSLCKPEDNPVNRLGITQAPTLPPPPTTVTTVTTTTTTTTPPRPPTAPLTPVPSGVCATCAANFGAPNSQQWCNCCKNDCQGSRSNCESLSGWCVDKCRQYPDVCAPTPATVPPTPAPTEAPTPLPTPLPTPPVAPEVFRSCIAPVPGLSVLWSIYSDYVRFRVDGPTSGFVALGFVDGVCAIDRNNACMKGADFVAIVRSNDLWTLDIRKGGSTNGEPQTSQHGVVTGLAGRLILSGPPQRSTTSMTFQRKIQDQSTSVRLRVSGADTRQTLLLAWGSNDQDALVYHGRSNRAAVVVDWARDVEECGRPPQPPLVTPAPTQLPLIDCDALCKVTYAVDSDSWCECCRANCFGYRGDCVRDNGFCDASFVPRGRCLREHFCAPTLPPTSVTSMGPDGGTTSDAATTDTTASRSSIDTTLPASPTVPTGGGILLGAEVDTGAIVGGVVGGLLAVGLLVGGLVWWRKRSDGRGHNYDSEFEKGAIPFQDLHTEREQVIDDDDDDNDDDDAAAKGRGSGIPRTPMPVLESRESTTAYMKPNAGKKLEHMMSTTPYLKPPAQTAPPPAQLTAPPPLAKPPVPVAAAIDMRESTTAYLPHALKDRAAISPLDPHHLGHLTHAPPKDDGKKAKRRTKSREYSVPPSDAAGASAALFAATAATAATATTAAAAAAETPKKALPSLPPRKSTVAAPPAPVVAALAASTTSATPAAAVPRSARLMAALDGAPAAEVEDKATSVRKFVAEFPHHSGKRNMLLGMPDDDWDFSDSSAYRSAKGGASIVVRHGIRDGAKTTTIKCSRETTARDVVRTFARQLGFFALHNALHLLVFPAEAGGDVKAMRDHDRPAALMRKKTDEPREFAVDLVAALGGDPLPAALRQELQYGSLSPEDQTSAKSKAYGTLPPEQPLDSAAPATLSESQDLKKKKRRTARPTTTEGASTTASAAVVERARGIEERCNDALTLIDASDGIHALIPLGQVLKQLQPEMQSAGDAVPGFKLHRPSEAAAGSSKLDLLKHALRHNVNELKRLAAAVKQAPDSSALATKVETLDNEFKL